MTNEQLIPGNPLTNLKKPFPEKKIIQALTPNDIERLFKDCSGKSTLDVRSKVILSVFLDTGLRVSELESLTIDYVDMDSGFILVRHGKGGKQRIIHIGSRAQNILWRYITIYRKSTTNALFISRSGNPLDVVGLKILIKRLGQRVQVINSPPHTMSHLCSQFPPCGGRFI